MIHYTIVHTQGKYVIWFNHQVNAYNPYSVRDTVTGKTVFSCRSLDVCLDFIDDNTRTAN